MKENYPNVKILLNHPLNFKKIFAFFYTMYYTHFVKAEWELPLNKLYLTRKIINQQLKKEES